MSANVQKSFAANNSNCIADIKEKAIVNIIADNIVFSRIYDGMHTVLNSFDPTKGDMDLKAEFNGIDIAFTLLDIADEDLCGILSETYHNIVCDSDELRPADELAVVIYYEWLTEIKNYFLTKKTA